MGGKQRTTLFMTKEKKIEQKESGRKEKSGEKGKK